MTLSRNGAMDADLQRLSLYVNPHKLKINAMPLACVVQTPCIDGTKSHDFERHDPMVRRPFQLHRFNTFATGFLAPRHCRPSNLGKSSSSRSECPPLKLNGARRSSVEKEPLRYCKNRDKSSGETDVALYPRHHFTATPLFQQVEAQASQPAPNVRT